MPGDEGQKAMEDWLRQIWERGKSPYARAFVLFVLLLLAELGLISVISDTGFSTEVQQYREFVWIAAIVIASLVAVIWLWRQLLERRKSIFFCDAQSSTSYLMDLSGKLREIPDKDTLTFLAHALGIPDSTLEVQSEEIVRLGGEKVISVKKWKRPLSQEEKAREDVSRRVGGAIEKTLSRFEEETIPQKIVIGITNRSKDMFLHIENIKFQHYKLPDGALLPSYHKSGASYTGIPFDENVANLAPGNEFLVDLGLRQKWDPSDIERMKGALGFLVLDVVYNEELVEGILIQV
jgi:hypothetical protein